MKHCTNLRVVGIALLCLIATRQGHALCNLVCNDLVQVSLDHTGTAVVLPDMILEGGQPGCPGPKTVSVMLPDGTMTGNTLDCSFVNWQLHVRVTDTGTGAYCWGAIVVNDKLPPTVSCRDTTVLCTADLSADSLGFPLIQDNCGGLLDTIFYDHNTLLTCSDTNTAVLLRTWHVRDASGNAADPCMQTIIVRRPTLADVQFPLNFDNVQRPAIPCSLADTSVAFTGMPMVDSIPVGNLCKITFAYEDLVIGACGLGFSVLRHWTVLDCCTGEIIEHNQLIKVEDNEPPVFTCPDTLFFPANGPGCAGTFLLPALPVNDYCSGVPFLRTITPNGMIEGNGGLVFGLPMGLHTVRYEASDMCGNHAHCEVTVVVQDVVPPVAICDQLTQVSLSSTGQASVPADVFDDGSYDACCNVGFLVKRMDEPNAPFLPDLLLGCADAGDSVRAIVQVADCFGNTNTCMVTVLTDDKIPPHLTCPPDLTLPCTDWQAGPVLPAATGLPFIEENCGLDTLFFADVENLNTCHSGTVVRTFTGVDGAGLSHQCTQRITLRDNTASQFFFPADTLTDCSVPIEDISAGQVRALGDCEAWSLNVSDEIFPQPCGLKIFRTYTFLDWCSGMDTAYTQFIEVRDTNPPVWNDAPGSRDTSYTCPGDLVKPGPPTARDYCSPNDEVPVTLVSDVQVDMGCPNRYVRTFTYTAMDTCGNLAAPFQIRIFVNDTIAPSANVPDRIFACQSEIPPFDPDEVDAFDNCPAPVEVVLFGQSVTGDDCMGTLVRTYLITDICGQSSLISQNFHWRDTIAPTAELMTLGPFPCLEFVPAPDPTSFLVTDNCKNDVTVTYVGDSTNVAGCNGLVWRTWRLTDECGNSALVTQILTVLDNVPPVMNCPGGVNVPLITETCSASIAVTVSGVDNCPGNTLTFSNSLGNGGATASGLFELGTHSIEFVAMDACGNMAQCTVPIVITEIVRPSNECEMIFVSLDENGQVVLNVDSLAAQGLIGGEDFCTDVTLSLDLDTLDCGDYVANFNMPLGVAILTYNLTVTDTFGNFSGCFNSIFLSDPLDICDDDPIVVGGAIFDVAGRPMPNVEARLLDNGNMTYTTTSAEGWFVFQNVPAGADCLLKPHKDDDIRNGVTTFDLLKITQHILGEDPLDTPYQLIAADANRSGAVTTFDVVLLRKVVLFTADHFPNNTSWRFVRADYVFPNPANPFAEPFPEQAWLNDIQRDAFHNHFIGIKIGDVNGSASPGLQGGNEDRGGEALVLAMNDRPCRPGETINIPVFAEGEIHLEALQATIQFDAGKLTFLGLRPAALDLKETDYAQPKSGSVTLSWMPQGDTPDGRFLQNNSVVFVLQFQVLHEMASLSEALAINSTLTPAIAYSNGGNPLNVIWRTHVQPHTMEVGAANFFSLSQNKPNPFGQSTGISFYLKEKMPVRLEVSDLMGRTINLFDLEMEAGSHETVIDREMLGAPGVYFYQLITPFGSERRTMVVD